MNIPKDIGVDNKIVKYKRMIRKCALNIQVWLENNTEPTQDDMAILIALIGKLKDNAYYYRLSCENWEKHTTTIDLPQPVLEHQAYLDKGISAEEEE